MKRMAIYILLIKEFKRACDQNIVVEKEAREYLEHGENEESYWTAAIFLKEIEHVITIAEIEYPKSEGYRLYWVFDHSSCHAGYAEDALIASCMNAKLGGPQPVMHDTVHNGRI